MTPREISIVLRSLIMGYFIGHFGIFDCCCALIGYAIYKLLGINLTILFQSLLKISGEGMAVLFNMIAESRGSPQRISASFLLDFCARFRGMDTQISLTIFQAECRSVRII